MNLALKLHSFETIAVAGVAGVAVVAVVGIAGVVEAAGAAEAADEYVPAIVVAPVALAVVVVALATVVMAAEIEFANYFELQMMATVTVAAVVGSTNGNTKSVKKNLK